jgi:Ca2+-binding EF-hand superfamily protein
MQLLCTLRDRGRQRPRNNRYQADALRIIFALMDSDGDGTVSLQEFQVAHEKSSRQWMPTKMASSLWTAQATSA